MSLQRLCGRLTRLEAQRRPAHVAAVLERVRQCAAPDRRQAYLLDELTTVDLATARAIMDQLTEAELEGLAGPEVGRLLDTLPTHELEALARGDAGATRRFSRAQRQAARAMEPPA